MFDIGFSELLLIAVVALVVVGPERLPKVARTLGLLLGRFQRYVGTVRGDIQRELQLEEIQRAMQATHESFLSAKSNLSERIINDEINTVEVLHQVDSAVVLNQGGLSQDISTAALPSHSEASIDTVVDQNSAAHLVIKMGDTVSINAPLGETMPALDTTQHVIEKTSEPTKPIVQTEMFLEPNDVPRQ